MPKWSLRNLLSSWGWQNKNEQRALVVCHMVLFVVVILDLDKTGRITIVCCVWEIAGEIFEILGRYWWVRNAGDFLKWKVEKNSWTFFFKREPWQKLVTGGRLEDFIYFTRTFKSIMFHCIHIFFKKTWQNIWHF